MQSFNVLGIMSGTSIDGLDLALCNFSSKKGLWKYEILKCNIIKYDKLLKKRLFDAHNLGAFELQVLDFEFGKIIANEVNAFLAETSVKVDFISSHGHTIFHSPQNGVSYQIGNGNVIAKETGLPVVYDFRSGDIALGGQGAPLVPIGDELLFGDFSACLNLGGFSNISYKNNENQRIAYDICPMNIVLNRFAKMLNLEFDDKGKIAASGNTNIELLNKLNDLDYYKQQYPKSLGREWVDDIFMNVVKDVQNLKIEDILNTLTVHFAEQISNNLKNSKNVLVTGGGAFNEFLIDNIRKNTVAEIIIPNNELINYKEAIIFAFLGLLRFLNKINCLSSVTGAKRNSCCGIVASY